MKKSWITGKELREYLERELELVFSADPWKLSGGWGPRASGISIELEAHATAGARLESVKVGGQPIRDDARYTLAGCEREGEPLDMICRLKGAHDPVVESMTIHQALRQYLARHPVIAPAREGRAVASDLPRHVFSQDRVLLGGW